MATFELVLATLVCAAVAFPFARLAADPGIVRAFPRVSLAFGAAVALGAIAFAASAWASPWFPRLAGGTGLAILAWHWWRARPNYGGSRGLPPGSLRAVPVEAWTDVLFFEKQAARYGPVFKVSHFFTPMVCVIGLRRGLDVFHRYDDSAMRSPAPPFARFLPCGFLRGMERERHEHYRAVIRDSITLSSLDALEPVAADRVRSVLEALARESAANPAGVYAPPHWDRLLLTLFLRLFFGIGEGDPDEDEVRRLFPIVNASGRRSISLPFSPADRRVRAALTRLHEILVARADAWRPRLDRGEPVPDCLLSQILRANAAWVRDPEVTGLLIYMTDAAARDLAGLLQWVVKMLCDYPAVASELRGEIARGVDQRGKSSLAHRIVWETLRLEQSEHLYRKVLDDIEIGDYRVPRGWLLRVCIRESHRLPEVFENPAVFDPSRFLRRTYTQYEFAPMGLFRHSCIGDTVTTTVARVLMTELVRGWEFQQAGESHRDFRGWHWTPGSDFRIAIRPGGATDPVPAAELDSPIPRSIP